MTALGADLSGEVWSPRLKALLAVLCVALFLDSMDVSMAGVALPSIRADLGLSTSALQWIVSGYVLGYGGFLLLGGRAADLLGRREMFLGSLALFTVATVAGGAVSTGFLVIAARFVKGVSAGFTAPAGLSIITTTFAAVAVQLAAFAMIEQRQASPLLRLGLLRGRSVVGANLAAFMFQGSYTGFQFILTLYLQRLLGWSPLETALAILPTGVLVGFIAPRMGTVIGRFGTTKLLVAGFVALAACYANMLRIGSHGDYAGVILPSMLLVGLSFVLCFPCINIQATSQMPDSEQGMASGLINTSFQIGAAVGLAAVTAIVLGATGASSGPHAQLVGYRTGLAASLAIGVLGLLVVTVGMLSRQSGRSQMRTAGPVSEAVSGVDAAATEAT